MYEMIARIHDRTEFDCILCIFVAQGQVYTIRRHKLPYKDWLQGPSAVAARNLQQVPTELNHSESSDLSARGQRRVRKC